jgi:hypothetical protein
MTHHLSGLHAIQDIIADAGGVQHWLEEAKDPSKSYESQLHEFQRWKAATKGVDGKNRKYVVRDELGCDASNRHCKKMLASLLPKIEEIAEREVAWEQSFRLANPSLSHEDLEEVIEGYQAYSGQATLELYRTEEEAGMLTRAEDEARVFMENRGREHEIAIAHDYPADQDDAITTHIYNHPRSQRTALLAQTYSRRQSAIVARSTPPFRSHQRSKSASHTTLMFSVIRRDSIRTRPLLYPNPPRLCLDEASSAPFSWWWNQAMI